MVSFRVLSSILLSRLPHSHLRKFTLQISTSIYNILRFSAEIHIHVYINIYIIPSSQIIFQFSKSLVNREAEMTNKWRDNCRCYLMWHLEKVFVYLHVNFQIGQRFMANYASGITSPQKEYDLFISLERDLL